MNLSYPKRLLFLAALAAFGVIIIVLGLFDLQVVNSEIWKSALEQRSNFRTTVRGARGEILDARGEVLARDVAGYDLMIVTAGVEGFLHECWRCGHRMSIRPDPKSETPMDQRYTRCPRCRVRSGEEPVFKLVDQRSMRPLASLLGWSDKGLQNEIRRHVERNRKRVAKAMEDAGNIGERRLKQREVFLRRKYGWQEYRVKSDVPYEAVREVALHPLRNPAFRIQECRVRRNVGGAAFAQMIGRKPDPVARADREKSGSGLELLCDSLLSGEPGVVLKVRDPDNPGALKVMRRDDPIDGVTVQLTIARSDQEAGMAALSGDAGALVVVNAETGAVLVLASTPSYEPEEFNSMWRTARREASRKGPPGTRRKPDPRLNRAVQGWYSPGSTMKPFTALAGLRFGAIRPSDTVDCRRLFTLNGKTMSYLRCNGTHGETDLRKALVKSCNVYFQTLMHTLLSAEAESQFEAVGHAFGFGKPTGLEIEWADWIERKTFRLRAAKGRSQYGSRLQHGIGQGYITATPAQVARAYAGLMTGQLPKLHLVGRRGSRRTRPERVSVGIPPPLLEQVREALRATNDPGGSLAKYGLDRYELALKTGTAQTNFPGRHTTWIAGFAEAHAGRPPLAFAMVVEYSSQHGGEECGPRLAQFLREFYQGARPQ
ncbi:MAG: penicillin-binding transpeptidase domain-containing protein [Planctomycetota bacterium]|jgi:penicillin-binding protein 2